MKKIFFGIVIIGFLLVNQPTIAKKKVHTNKATIVLTVEVEYSAPYSPEYLAEGEEQLRKDIDLNYSITPGVSMNVLNKKTKTIVQFNE